MKKREIRTDYTLIETEKALAEFYETNKNVEWFCFDTEFIGEKRYTTLLCLIQVATEHGLYLIDSLKIDNLQPFLRIIEDPAVLKITHAGENDYRLLNILFDTVPKNIFDAQVAAGFVGYRYPASFRTLVEGEVGVRLSKGFGVTDWEKRPISSKQIDYALDDVVHLKKLYDKLTAKAEINGRISWVWDECRLWENPDYYYLDPHREALGSNIIRNVRLKEQAFLLRLYAWRDKEARRKDYSKEMILSKKLIAPVTKAMASGKAALLGNRRIPERTSRRFADMFLEMYARPVSPEEKAILNRIPHENDEDPEQNIMTEMLHLITRQKCLQEDMSVNLVMPRSIVKDMKQDPNFFEPILETTWRKEFLGERMIFWLKNRNNLDMSFAEGNFQIVMKQ